MFSLKQPHLQYPHVQAVLSTPYCDRSLTRSAMKSCIYRRAPRIHQSLWYWYTRSALVCRRPTTHWNWRADIAAFSKRCRATVRPCGSSLWHWRQKKHRTTCASNRTASYQSANSCTRPQEILILLLTLQQKIPMFFNRPDNPENWPFPDGDLETMVPWAHRVTHPNGISIGSAVFAQCISVTNTHRHTDHATCDILSQ